MVEVVIEHCQDRFWFQYEGERHKFKTYRDIETWLATKGMVIVRITECKGYEPIDCCKSFM